MKVTSAIMAICTVLTLAACGKSDASKVKLLQGEWVCSDDTKKTFDGKSGDSTILDGDNAGSASWFTFDFVDGQFRMQTTKLRVAVNDAFKRNQMVRAMASNGDMQLAQSLMQQGYYDTTFDRTVLSNLTRLDEEVLEYQPTSAYKHGQPDSAVGRSVHCDRKHLSKAESERQQRDEQESQKLADASLAIQIQEGEWKQQLKAATLKAEKFLQSSRPEDIETASKEAAKIAYLPKMLRCVPEGQPVPSDRFAGNEYWYTDKSFHTSKTNETILGDEQDGSDHRHLKFLFNAGQKFANGTVIPEGTGIELELDSVVLDANHRLLYGVSFINSRKDASKTFKDLCWDNTPDY